MIYTKKKIEESSRLMYKAKGFRREAFSAVPAFFLYSFIHISRQLNLSDLN